MNSSFARAIGTTARAVAAAVRAAGAVLTTVIIAGCLLFIAAVGAIAVVLFTGAPVLVPGVIHLWRDASAGDPAIMFVPRPAGILVSILAVAAVVWIARRPPQGVRRRPLRPPRPPAPR